MYITLLIFSDEVIFHLILQNWFKQIVTIRSEFLASWLPIALAAFFYAISQYYLGPLAVIAAIFGGAIYGFIYQKSGKIELAILVHIAVRLALGLIFTFGIADKVMPLLY
jgi:membrane protease YdiL (CAAX protease family)